MLSLRTFGSWASDIRTSDAVVDGTRDPATSTGPPPLIITQLLHDARVRSADRYSTEVPFWRQSGTVGRLWFANYGSPYPVRGQIPDSQVTRARS